MGGEVKGIVEGDISESMELFHKKYFFNGKK